MIQYYRFELAIKFHSCGHYSFVFLLYLWGGTGRRVQMKAPSKNEQHTHKTHHEILCVEIQWKICHTACLKIICNYYVSSLVPFLSLSLFLSACPSLLSFVWKVAIKVCPFVITTYECDWCCRIKREEKKIKEIWWSIELYFNDSIENGNHLKSPLCIDQLD